MTYRNRALLDLAHEAPCMLQLGVTALCETVHCGEFPSVPCHSDMLRHGRGGAHKSHDCLAVPGCPACHAVFTREHLGRDGYEQAWLRAHERYQIWLWENKRVRVA